MRKLHHQNSCHVTAVETSHTDHHQQTDLSPSAHKEVKALEGKILLLEERGKTIQQFYENKLSQLRAVLAKQGETRGELLSELQRLSAEGHKQQRYVGQLKGILEEERLNGSQRLRLRPAAVQPSAEKYAVKRSKGKGCLLFNSKDLASTPAHRLALKKSKSEQFLESEYFITEGEGRPEKSTPSLNNP
jgi:hypothetical protein